MLLNAAKLVLNSRPFARMAFDNTEHGRAGARLDDDPGEILLMSLLALFGFKVVLRRSPQKAMTLKYEASKEFLQVRGKYELLDPNANKALMVPFAWT